MSYDMIDRFLRNNLSDDDYAEYSAALDSLYVQGEPPVIDSEETASIFMEKKLWEIIDIAAMFPKAQPDPRTWEILKIYAPRSEPLTDEEINALDYSGTRVEFVRDIEAKLREKNL